MREIGRERLLHGRLGRREERAMIIDRRRATTSRDWKKKKVGREEVRIFPRILGLRHSAGAQPTAGLQVPAQLTHNAPSPLYSNNNINNNTSMFRKLAVLAFGAVVAMGQTVTTTDVYVLRV
jgi:hypothetical protein